MSYHLDIRFDLNSEDGPVLEFLILQQDEEGNFKENKGAFIKLTDLERELNKIRIDPKYEED